MQREKVTLVKKNGTVIDDIGASVQENKIITPRVDVPFEVDDHILRKLPNGLQEDIIILNPVYIESPARGTIPSHYSISYKRSGQSGEKQTIINNISGNFAKVNIGEDRSIVQHIHGEENVFEKLTVLLEKIQNEKDRERLTLIANELEALKGKDGFKDKYMEFVSSAANHVSILAPLLPILASLG